MTTPLTPTPPIPIELLVGDDLKQWADEWNPASQRLPWRIETELRSLLDDLGIPGRPVVEVKHSPGVKQARVLLRGSVHPYSAQSARQLAEYFSEEDFPAQLVLEAIKQSPAALLGDEQLDAYLSHAGRVIETPDAAAPQRERVKRILGSLLNLKLSIKDSGMILGRILKQSGEQNGRSEVEIAEDLAARLTPNRVEVGIDRDYLRQAFNVEMGKGESRSVFDVKIDAKIREDFKMLADGMFYELGVRVPDVVLTATDSVKVDGKRKLEIAEVAPDVVLTATDSVKWRGLWLNINGFRCAPHLGIAPDRLLVNNTKDNLTLLGFKAEKAINPANDNECGLINRADRQKAEDAGMQVWDAVGYLILLVLARELRRNAGRLLHVEKVEYELAQLGQIFPELIGAVMEKVPTARLTRVLRSLLDEEISIRDLRTILERVLTCDHVVFDASEHIVFDDRLVFHTAPAGGWMDDGHSLARYVRAGLKRYISHKYTRGQSTLVVYLIDPQIDELLFDHLAFERGDEAKPALSAEAVERLRAAIRKEVDVLPASAAQMTIVTVSSLRNTLSAPPAAARPAILTLSEVRYLLRSLVASEFPALAVLAYDELSPEMNIQPIARISLPEET